MTDKKHYSPYPGEFTETMEKIVVGHRIVDAKDDVITLDNGYKVRLTGASDCCAWGDVSVLATTLANSEHVITGVKEVVREGDAAWGGDSSWFILGDGHEILQIDGSWDASSGYYFYGFYVDVVPVDEDFEGQGW